MVTSFFSLNLGRQTIDAIDDNATSESNDWRFELLVSRDPYNGL